jgi:multidrug efflux system membrane fusion protein
MTHRPAFPPDHPRAAPAASLGYGRRAKALLIATLWLAISAGCTGERADATPAEAPRPVRSIVVGATATADRWSLPGEIKPRIEVRYGFRVGGRLLERKVQVGDQVAPGQLLARLDPRDLTPALEAQRAQEAAARTELVLATADLARAEKLRSGNFVSDANVDRARAAVRAAQARLEAAGAQVQQARNSLSFQHLTADTAGVVVGVDAEAGQVLAVGQSVVRIAQKGDLEVAINIGENDLDRARRNPAWAVTVAGLPQQQWEARLRELSPAADPASRTYSARLTIGGDTSALAYGMSATVLGTPATDDRIRIPLTALFSRDGKPRVWLVGQEGVVVSRAVSTGRLGDDSVEITDGLAGGERVVTAGANLLRENQRVKVVDAATMSAGAASGTVR